MKYELQRSFAAGELSELLYMRNDFENIYNSGVSKLRNMRPDSRGPAISRDGMKHIFTIAGADNARVVVLELVDEFIVFVFTDLLLTIVRNIDNPITSTLVAPWTADQIDSLQFASVPADNVVYIAHPNVQTYKLEISAIALQSQSFFADGTFVVPAGITSMTICVSGGGGGGGGGAHSYLDTGGGGGGSGAVKGSITTIPAEVLDIIIGSGGSLGAGGGAGSGVGFDGGDGSISSISGDFGIISAEGGKGGVGGGGSPAGGLGSDGGGNGGAGADQGSGGEDGIACSAVCSGGANRGGRNFGLDAGGGGGGGGFGAGGNSVSGSTGISALDNSGAGGAGGGYVFLTDGKNGGLGGSGRVKVFWEISTTFALAAVTFTALPVNWNGTNWPSVLAYFQGRLWLGGTPSDPEEFVASVAGSPEDLTIASGAMVETLQNYGAIKWIIGTKALVIGTLEDEYLLASDNRLLDAAGISAEIQSSYGSSNAQAIIIGDQIIYISADSRRVNAMDYDWGKNNWSSIDLSFFSEHLTEGLVKNFAWAQQPDRILWMVLQNGNLASLSYERSNNAFGWALHDTQGSVLSVASGFDGQQSVLVLAVQRNSGDIEIERFFTEYKLDSWKETSSVASNRWNISASVFFQNFDIFTSSGELYPYGIFFKEDGLKLYTIGFYQNYLSEHELSVAWDISTATLKSFVDMTGTDQLLRGLFIDPTGLKLYFTGGQFNKVYEWDLGTAWDISTISYSQLFDPTVEDAFPMGVSFRFDGFKMYIVGTTNDKVYEYNLTVAWDISTAVVFQSLDISAEDTQPLEIFFKEDGLKMYIVGNVSQSIYEYDLSLSWDISTAIFKQPFRTSSEETNPQGVFIRQDGLKMYLSGASGNGYIYEYDFVGDYIYVEGFDHLEGMTVQILIDDAVHPERIVGSESSSGAGDGVVGRVYLETEGSNVVIGLQYIPQLVSLPSNKESVDGNDFMHQKTYSEIAVKLLNSRRPMVNGRDTFERSPNTPQGTPEPAKTELLIITDTGWDQDALIEVTQPLPYHLKIAAIGGKYKANKL